MYKRIKVPKAGVKGHGRGGGSRGWRFRRRDMGWLRDRS